MNTSAASFSLQLALPTLSSSLLFAGWVALDADVGPQLLKPGSGDAADDKQIFDAAEWPALFAEMHDGPRRRRPNSGQLLKFFERGGVQVKRFRGRLLSGLRRHCEHNRTAEKHRGGCADMPIYRVHGFLLLNVLNFLDLLCFLYFLCFFSLLCLPRACSPARRTLPLRRIARPARPAPCGRPP